MAFLLSGERPLAAAPSASLFTRAANRLAQVVFAMFFGVLSAIRAARRGRHSLISLEAMSAVRLRDLGLTHEDIHAAARAPDGLAGNRLSAARARNAPR